MVNLSLLKKAARFETDANGEEVVVIPRRMWDDVLEPEPGWGMGQGRIQDVLNAIHQWQPTTADDKSPAWWDEFDQFLKDNRPAFPVRDYGWGDDERLAMYWIRTLYRDC
jgi:hypothetical protein